jgi:acyl-coenzyme A thioesterase PaaI-like protein
MVIPLFQFTWLARFGQATRSEDRAVRLIHPHLCTTAGVTHGGVLMSLADTAGLR